MENTEIATGSAENNIKEGRRAYSRSLLNIAIFFLIAFVIITVVRQFMPDDISLTALYLLNYIPMYLIAFPLYLLISKRLPTAVPEKQHMSFGQILLAFLCCECLAIGGNLIGTIINLILSTLIGQNTASTFLQEGIFGEGSLLFICIAVIGAPIVEETVFRKILIDRTRKYGDSTAILMSGIMFGLFHGNLTQFFYAALLGLLFAFIYVRTGKIQYTIILHMMVNFWGSAMPLLMLRNLDTDTLLAALSSGDYSTITGMIPQMIPFLCFVFINYSMALAGLVLLILNRKKIQVAPPTAPIPKGKRFQTACINVGFFAMLAVTLYEFIRQFMAVL